MSTLPLGVDIGRRRIRIAVSTRDPVRGVRLAAVSARDHDGDPVDALVDALAELPTRERRCVVALGAPDALLCTLPLPPMPSWERMRAARFEAARLIDYPMNDATLSMMPSEQRTEWIVGIARRAVLTSALTAVRRAHLRPIAVDDVTLALRRAHPKADCVIDIASDATRIALLGPHVPLSVCLATGGRHLTAAIARSLGIDTESAERRKRRTGFGGAGEAERDLLVASIAEAIGDARRSSRHGIARIVLCGNGARIPGFERALADATDADVSLAVLEPDSSDTVPADVLRVAGPDWSVAYGLSRWSAAS